MQKVIQQIRRKLYLAMDGANASSMRKKGIHYQMIFGVPIVTLRKMASDYAPNSELADNLWSEDNRELKILATLIQSPETFSKANEWVSNIQNLELAEQACANLFCRLPDAGQLAKKWIQSPDTYIQISGFILYTRLFMKNFQLENDTEAYFHAVFNAINSDSMLLKNAALTSLKKLGRQSVIHAKDILARFETSLFYDDLNFEFNYYT